MFACSTVGSGAPVFPWGVLERVRGQRAVAAAWRQHLGREFEPFCDAFLRPWRHPAATVPCPRDCGCAHAVVRHGDDRLVGICQCESWNCPDLVLTPRDLVVWEMAWDAFLVALRMALSLSGLHGPIRIAHCHKVGYWSRAQVPVILMVEPDPWRHVARVAELITQRRGKFILLVPTAESLGNTARGMLVEHRICAAVLEEFLALAPLGTLRATVPPGELFLSATPPRDERVEDTAARQAMAILEKIEAESGALKPPSLLEVFTFYALKGYSVRKIATRLRCAPSTVGHRVVQLTEIFKVPLHSFRAMTGHLQREPRPDTAAAEERAAMARLRDENDEEEDEFED